MSTFSAALKGRIGQASKVATRLVFDSTAPFLVTFVFSQRVREEESIKEVEQTWEVGRELLLLGLQGGRAGDFDITATHDKEERTLGLRLRSAEGEVTIVFPCNPIEMFLDTAEKMCPAKAMYDGFGEQAAKTLIAGP